MEPSCWQHCNHGSRLRHAVLRFCGVGLHATIHLLLKLGSPPHFSSARACGSVLFVCSPPPLQLPSAASAAAVCCLRSCRLFLSKLPLLAVVVHLSPAEHANWRPAQHKLACVLSAMDMCTSTWCAQCHGHHACQHSLCAWQHEHLHVLCTINIYASTCVSLAPWTWTLAFRMCSAP